MGNIAGYNREVGIIIVVGARCTLKIPGNCRGMSRGRCTGGTRKRFKQSGMPGLLFFRKVTVRRRPAVTGAPDRRWQERPLPAEGKEAV